MKDYYQILGVSQSATIAEIKRAFRRLAIAYHPDRNPSKEAESFIKDVIEAYEILEDPIQRALYDSLISGPVPLDPKISRPHRDPHYRRQPPNPNYKSEKQQTLEMMQEYMPYAYFVSCCALAFSLFLFIDFSLQPVRQTEVIAAIKKPLYGNESERFTTDRGHEFKIDRYEALKFQQGESITISYSPWLKIPLFLMNSIDRQPVKIPATIYGNFIFVPFFLSLASITGVVFRKGTMFRFNLGIVNFLLMLLTGIFLVVHHLHLS